MIIISESSAEATRPVCTGRSTPVQSRTSAPHNETPRQPKVRPQSAFTQKCSQGSLPTGVPGSSGLHEFGVFAVDWDQYNEANCDGNTQYVVGRITGSPVTRSMKPAAVSSLRSGVTP